ncbi:uncharacterized protein LOC121718337 [Alosa sapidissima]|uniref:uncharacterized protein LOC121718337 n=1 Tax=Alosa sapidissima TaxID=34773 RepID=UPI001C09D76A|nr:uncharacterized protein LOC121718337 [Alosa sapidissima]
MPMSACSVSSSKEDRGSVASAMQCLPDLDIWDTPPSNLWTRPVAPAVRNTTCMVYTKDSRTELCSRIFGLHTEGVGSTMETDIRTTQASIYRMVQRMGAFEERMEGKMNELLMLLRGSQSPLTAPEDPLLLSPCSSVTELQEFDRSLGEQERRNKMQHFLTTLGGSNPGAATRRMLRRVPTNDVLSQYSLRGRKSKKSFQHLTLCRVITAASQKNFPGLTAVNSEDLIGQTLKFAPHRRPTEKD